MSDQFSAQASASDDPAVNGGADASNTDTPPDLVSQLGGNPAWGEIFDKLPGGYQQMIAPTLQKWDKNFQQVQEQFAPYKSFAEQKVSADDIQQAMELRKLALENPRQIFDVLQQTFGEEWGLTQGQPETPQVPQQGQPQDQVTDLSAPPNPADFDITQHPKVQEMMKNQDTMAQYLATQIQQQQQIEQDQALDAEITRLKEKYGDWDEATVFSYAQADPGKPLEQFVLQYKALEEQIRSRPGAADGHPRLVPPGGGIPSEAVDVTKLSGQDRRGLVANYLRNAFEQQG